jgi:UDPglucose 6-dehydrogenase
MLGPDLILIGESDERAGGVIASVYEPVCEGHPVVRRMNFVNAELTKISINTFVTTKISYANMLADMCDRLPDADVDVVTDAVGSDSRIGKKYLRGAVGYGGPCFPRDNVAFAALAAVIGARADLAVATDAINRHQVERLLEAVRARVSSSAAVAVLGMTYKAHTPVIEESQGVMLARLLRDNGFRVIIHDPISGESAKIALGDGVALAQTAETAIADADIAVLMTPWPQYQTLNAAEFDRSIPVIDCWRILKPSSGTLQPVWMGAGKEVMPAMALGSH